MSTPPPRFRQLFVLGVPRCGSSLLAKYLDSHPRMASVGELAFLGDDLEKGKCCSCGKNLTECSFWNPILALLNPQGRSFHRKLSPDIYERLRQHLQADVIVDTSKALAWKMLHRPFSRWRKVPAGRLVLIRDSRGVLASDLKRGKNLDSMLEKHRKWMMRMIKHAQQNPECSLILHYEDLCADPEATCRRICDWIGLPFAEVMLQPLTTEHHFVSSSNSEYTKTKTDVIVDDRWRATLDADKRDRIEAMMRDIPLMRRYLDQSA